MKRTTSSLFALMLLLALGACKNTSTQPAAEDASPDTTAVARQDSTDVAIAAPDGEQAMDEETKHFYEQFDMSSLLCLLMHYETQAEAEKSGLTFIYMDEETGEDMHDLEYVYGRNVEKGEKREFGYALTFTAPHACYFKMNLDTSTYASLRFSDKDDAKRFFEKCADLSLTFEGVKYKTKSQPDGSILVTYYEEAGEDSFWQNHVCLYPPKVDKGFHMIDIEFYV